MTQIKFNEMVDHLIWEEGLSSPFTEGERHKILYGYTEDGIREVKMRRKGAISRPYIATMIIGVLPEGIKVLKCRDASIEDINGSTWFNEHASKRIALLLI
jgi:hypothetical protein